jgi:arylsulfatase
MPTLAEITGARIPDGADGISFAPLIVGKDQEEHDYLYWEFPAYGGQQALRKGKWKAVRQGLKQNPTAPVELYDLGKDQGEENDVSRQYPEILNEMRQLMQEARKPSAYFPFPALDGDSLNIQLNME